MSEALSLARVKNTGNGRISHVAPEHSRLARLGADSLWALIHGGKRLIFFHPHTQTITSSLGEPLVTEDRGLAVTVVRPEEIIRFGLPRSQDVGRNGVKSVVAF